MTQPWGMDYSTFTPSILHNYYFIVLYYNTPQVEKVKIHVNSGLWHTLSAFRYRIDRTRKLQ